MKPLMFIGLEDTMNQLSYNLCKEVRAKIIIKFLSLTLALKVKTK